MPTNPPAPLQAITHPREGNATPSCHTALRSTLSTASLDPDRLLRLLLRTLHAMTRVGQVHTNRRTWSPGLRRTFL